MNVVVVGGVVVMVDVMVRVVVVGWRGRGLSIRRWLLEVARQIRRPAGDRLDRLGREAEALRRSSLGREH